MTSPPIDIPALRAHIRQLSASMSDADRAPFKAEMRRRDIAASFVRWLPSLTIHDDDPVKPSAVPFVPYPYQVERGEAWQRGESEVNLKARQLGFSWLAAAYKLWRAAFHGWSVAYISKGQVEARAHLESRVRFMWRNLASVDMEAPRWTADSVDFGGGGSIRVFPSTPDAGVQYTFQLVVFDEFSRHDYGAANWAAILPTLSRGGQILVMSTANPELGPAGAFYNVWTQAEQGLNGLTPVFTPVRARPGRDDAWLERERARVGDSQRSDADYPETPAQAFVGRSGLVFPMFSRERHVRPTHPVAWPDCKYRVVGVDFGGTGANVTAAVPLGIYQDRQGGWHLHQFTEFYRKGVTSEQDVVEWLHQVDRLGRLDRVWVDAGSGTTTVVATMRQLGVAAVQAANKDRASRLSWHSYLLEHSMLTLHQSCANGIGEYAGYRWIDRVDPSSREKYQTGTPGEHHADAIDARGYAILGAMTGLIMDASSGPVPMKWGRGKEKAPEDGWEYVKWKLEQQKKAVE